MPRRLAHSPLLALSLCILPGVLAAQGANPVNLWSVTLRQRGDSIEVGAPVKLTGDRGTNSQPAFSPDGRTLVFSAIRDTGRDARSDIWRIDLATGAESRVTRTAENENSPTVDARGGYMAVRWVPATLFREYGPWRYAADGTPTSGVLPGPDTTGYYTPLAGGRFALTRPRRPFFTVAIFDPRRGTITDVDSGVPALPAQRIPRANALSWVKVDSAAARHGLRRMDLATGRIITIGSTVPGRTVHAWMADGRTVLMAKGQVLYARRVGRDTTWRPIATFMDPGLRHAAAYVVSPRGDRLVLTSPVKLPLAVALRDSLEAGHSAQAVASMARAWREAGTLGAYDVGEGALAALADDRLTRGRAEEAVVLAEMVVSLFPASHLAAARLGDAGLAAGRRDAAVAAWRRALELNPRATDDDRRAADAVSRKLAERAP